MLRRVLEGSLVAVVASLVTWALSTPNDPIAAATSLGTRVLQGIGTHIGPLTAGMWILAVGLCMAGLAFQIHYMASASGREGSEWSLVTPSLPTTLLGFGVGLGVLAMAGRLASAGSMWSFPLLAMLVYWSVRWLIGLRYRWISAAGII